MKGKNVRLSYKNLLTMGIPAVLIPGILLAMTLGWNGNPLTTVQNYHDLTQIYPHAGQVMTVTDGDTFQLRTGQQVRLLGINTPDRGERGYIEGKDGLEGLVKNKQVYLEYDRYQDDKYGRILAWVWINCEGDPTFLASDYMHDTKNHSRPGLLENPEHCKEGTLVNEALVKEGYAAINIYKDRGPLKYEERMLGR